jgi:hypothetical protein
MNQKANIIQWAIALAIGLAIGLPAALTTTHHVSQRESVHVVAAIIAILVLDLDHQGLVLCRGVGLSANTVWARNAAARSPDRLGPPARTNAIWAAAPWPPKGPVGWDGASAMRCAVYGPFQPAV